MEKIVPFNSPPVPIFTLHMTGKEITEEQHDETVFSIISERDFKQEQVRFVCTVTLNLLFEISFLVTISTKSIIQLNSFTLLEEIYLCIVARTVMDVYLQRPF